MKETYYFQHDYNARDDEKIIGLRKEMGWEGYGLFWALLEKLYEARGHLNFDCSCLAFSLQSDSEKIERVITGFGLFDSNEKTFTSKTVLERLKERDAKIENARASANSRWSNANAMRTQCERNANPMLESKVKESKVKKIKVNESKVNIHPKFDDVKAYCDERGSKIDPQQFFDYYEARGWMLGKNKIKNWKACVSTWERNDYGRNQNNHSTGNGGRSIAGAAAPVPGKYDEIEAAARSGGYMGKDTGGNEERIIEDKTFG